MYTPGSQNPSDYLSRHAIPDEEQRRSPAEEYVHFIAANAVPKAMTLEEIQSATKRDKTLQCVSWLIRNGEWHKIDNLPAEHQEANTTELKLFSKIKDELTVGEDGLDIVLKSSRIVVPAELREKAIALAHEGHQGLVKTKCLLREKVWFPGIDQSVKRAIETCLACQANGPDSRPNPLQMSPLPPAPWHTLHIDFCGPFPTGEYVLVVIDAYTRFPEAAIVKSTSAKAVIPTLDRIFATHGIPVVLRSDNGPPFTSHEIEEYMKENGINHQRITPLWPQANSEAESFMKPLTKAIRSAHAEGKQWTKHLYKFLLSYRTTPHTTTGYAPATLLFNREVRNKLPNVVILNSNQQVEENDKNAKFKMKEKADKRRRAKESDLKVGDTVLARQRKHDKFSMRFDPNPFRVFRKKGTMVTAYRSGKYITRNISRFKVIDSAFQESAQEDDEDDDLTTDGHAPVIPVPPQPALPAAPANPTRQSQRGRNPPNRYGTYVYYCLKQGGDVMN